MYFFHVYLHSVMCYTFQSLAVFDVRNKIKIIKFCDFLNFKKVPSPFFVLSHVLPAIVDTKPALKHQCLRRDVL
jgi:hypothetical protein